MRSPKMFATVAGTLLLVGAMTAVIAIAACSRSNTPSTVRAAAPQQVHATVRPAAMVTTEPIVNKTEPEVTKPAVKPASKLITFKSRDYGVSFVYPWQYAFRNARTIAADESLKPETDGHDGQVTLARVDVPAGFYPGTDFESGYLALSLNQSLDEQQCSAILGTDEEAKLHTDTINGVEFRWMESERGGHGSAVKVRNYVAYVNGACYEIEMAVKTSNQDGLAREIDPEQVMKRLDGVLRTVTIAPLMKDAKVQTASAEQK